jgi:diguanylate cyclase (GGDEF)-like protein/PAS domain S-box-containing protein
MKASLPRNESERLEALFQTGLLDSHAEEEFDSLVRLASVVCSTPIALLTLVDENRQWFKAKVGLNADETHRDIAFCAHTILDDELFVVPDALLDPRFADNPLVLGDPSIRFYAGVSLKSIEGYRLGTLCVIDRSPKVLSRSQREALVLLSEQANKQINMRRQQAVLEQAVAESSLINEELRKNQGLFHTFMDNCLFIAFMKRADGRFVYYNQLCADRFGVDREAWLGKTDADLWDPDLAVQIRANDLTVLREWDTVIREERSHSDESRPSLWRSYKFPFRDSEGREYVAGFAVDITATALAEEQIRTYQMALEDANERLHMLAVTDSLTGLQNRRAFEAALRREVDSSRRYGHPLSLLMLDVDTFKSFNDDFGHEEGDRVLQGVARVIAASFRATDTVARYGGEEFAVILPHTTAELATESAERIRLAVSQFKGARRPVTVSIGLARFERGWEQLDLIRKADQALYSAKRAGKNRVCRA